jgi:hypothetical protein
VIAFGLGAKVGQKSMETKTVQNETTNSN